ncbi:MAG: phosphoribosylformylglycinamidine synthase subunit PurQ [Syntrophothermus sp.]
MKFAIVVFPGSNCDHDCFYAVRDVIGQEAELIWHTHQDLSGFDCVILPGGFSYGDYLRSGAIARFAPVMAEVERFARAGGPVLGICNGFQILLEAGLLPGAMLRNRDIQFRCEQTYIRVETGRTPFTGLCQPGRVLQVPIAHGEGNYFIDEAGLAELEANHQVVFRYTDAAGRVTPESNPNGSVANIAGVCNREGNVVGLMPHPERSCEGILGSADGRVIFESVVASVTGRQVARATDALIGRQAAHRVEKAAGGASGCR